MKNVKLHIPQFFFSYINLQIWNQWSQWTEGKYLFTWLCTSTQMSCRKGAVKRWHNFRELLPAADRWSDWLFRVKAPSMVCSTMWPSVESCHSETQHHAPFVQLSTLLCLFHSYILPPSFVLNFKNKKSQTGSIVCTFPSTLGFLFSPWLAKEVYNFHCPFCQSSKLKVCLTGTRTLKQYLLLRQKLN